MQSSVLLSDAFIAQWEAAHPGWEGSNEGYICSHDITSSVFSDLLYNDKYAHLETEQEQQAAAAKLRKLLHCHNPHLAFKGTELPLVDINARYHYTHQSKETMLGAAAAEGLLWAIDPLIEAGAKLNPSDSLSPFMLALSNNHVDVMEKLHGLGADYPIERCIRTAAMRGHVASLEFLFAHHPDSFTQTVLEDMLEAGIVGHAPISVQWALAHGAHADIIVRDAPILTHVVKHTEEAKEASLAIAKILIAAGADMHKQDDAEGLSPIEHALREANYEAALVIAQTKRYTPTACDMQTLLDMAPQHTQQLPAYIATADALLHKGAPFDHAQKALLFVMVMRVLTPGGVSGDDMPLIDSFKDFCTRYDLPAFSDTHIPLAAYDAETLTRLGAGIAAYQSLDLSYEEMALLDERIPTERAGLACIEWCIERTQHTLDAIATRVPERIAAGEAAVQPQALNALKVLDTCIPGAMNRYLGQGCFRAAAAAKCISEWASQQPDDWQQAHALLLQSIRQRITNHAERVQENRASWGLGR